MCNTSCIDENMNIDEETGDKADDYDSELCDSGIRYTPEKATFNASLGNHSEDWTLLKYQLGGDFNTINKKSKQHIANNAMKAIDTVLEKIAPGQSSSLKEECFQLQNKKNKHNYLDA